MIVRTIIASRFMDAPRRTHSPPDRSVTKKTFSHLQPARIVLSPQTLHGGRARRAHPKSCQPFSIQFIVFSRGQNVDFWLLSKNNIGRLPLRGTYR